MAGNPPSKFGSVSRKSILFHLTVHLCIALTFLKPQAGERDKRCSLPNGISSEGWTTRRPGGSSNCQMS
jgi:hypothetical protein